MKMTKIEALGLLREMVANQEATATNTDLIAWIDGQTDVIAAALAKDKAKRDAKRAAAGPDELAEVIYTILSNAKGEKMSIPKIMSMIEGATVTAPLVTTRLTALQKAGKVQKEVVKEPKTEDSPAHTYTVYFAV